MAGGFPAERLRREMLRRMNDGWDVLERGDRTLVMLHGVDPPWWRLMLELPAVLLGGAALPTVTVRLTVRIDEDGRLWRRTEGDVPRRWRRPFPWWPADGPDDRA